MKQYTVIVRLDGALADAVALEWTSQAAPLDSGRGWEPCLRRADGAWRFSSHDPLGAAPPHRRRPGAFGDIAIRYRLDAAGPWSASPPHRKEIVIVEVIEDDDEQIPPTLLAAPSLTGAAVVGAELTVDPGLWGGFPTPDLAFQWRRDGTDIPGAVARAYATGPADDLSRIDCIVTAGSALGAATAQTGELRMRYPAPARLAELPEEVFDEGAGPQLVETAFVFSGPNLTFAAAGATIDPDTGVLVVATDRPASGVVVTITATNSGGEAIARLRYTVEAAPPIEDAPRALGAGDATILRSVWRPAGQTQTFTPIAGFPGLAGETVDAVQWTESLEPHRDDRWHPARPKAGEIGAYEIFHADHPLPAGVFDPALFRADQPARLDRLRFRWRESAGGRWSDPGDALRIPLPTPVATGTLGAPGTAMVRQSFLNGAGFRSFQTYDFLGSSLRASPYTSTCINDAKRSHLPQITALAAFMGMTEAQGGRTVAQHMAMMLTHWAENGAPAARGGVGGQRDFMFCVAAALGKATPAVWNGVSTANRTRIDRVMEGLLVTACWQNSDNNPHVRSGGDERTITGGEYARTRVPNFTIANQLTPYVVAAYMGLAEASNFLRTFDRTAFAAAINAARNGTPGLADLWDTFRQNWTGGPNGAGPTAAELQAAIRQGPGGGEYVQFGVPLSNATAAAAREVDRMWGATMRAGIDPAGVDRVPAGVEKRAGQLGVFEHASHSGAPNSARGRNAQVACLTDMRAWPAHIYAGQVGMARELDAADGGTNGSGGGPRSSMSYAVEGAQAILTGVACLAALGKLNRADPALQAAFVRQNRGVYDLRFRSAHGHRSFAKGGRLWAGNGTNSDWDDAEARLYQMYELFDLWDDVLKPWAGL